MVEILFLNSFLLVGLLLAPTMTRMFLLKGSRAYSDGFKTTLIILLAGVFFDLNQTFAIWPLFCFFGALIYLKNEFKSIPSLKGVAKCIPLIFSLISSVWFVSGFFDLHLLGYSKSWSFYAALHGCFLGWIFVGCLAYLSERKNSTTIYLWGCYFSFLFFLLVAFGIDGVPYIKRIGVVGFSLMAPFLIAHYSFNLKRENKRSRLLSFLSLFSIVLSMILALLNEFWPAFPRTISDVPTMVLTHGLLNALVAIPCFFLAILFEHRDTANPTRPNDSVVFFDGYCNLCNKTVAVLIRLDKQRKIKYSSLQGKFIRELKDLDHINPAQSVIFLNNGLIYEKAEAVISILVKIGGFYSWMGFTLRLFPLFILNPLYSLVARNRYRIFGKRDSCLMPTDEIKKLFIP